jgi:hypothetical protein
MVRHFPVGGPALSLDPRKSAAEYFVGEVSWCSISEPNYAPAPPQSPKETPKVSSESMSTVFEIGPFCLGQPATLAPRNRATQSDFWQRNGAKYPG